MSDEITAEIKLLHDQFLSASRETSGEVTKLGSRFEAVFAKMGVASDAGIAAVVGQLEKLDSKFAKTMQNAQSRTDSLKFEKLAEGFKTIGAASGGAFSGAIDGGQKYEAAINRIRAISGLGGADITKLNKDIESLGREFGFAVGPTQTAEIALQALGSGFETVAESTTIAKSSLALIADGTTNATDATKLLVGTLNAYGQGADGAAKLTDQLFQVQNRGVVTISEMSQTLGLVTKTAASAGVSFEELGAAVIVATRNNVPFTSSVEGFRGLLVSLENPTEQAKKAMEKYGLSINYATLRQKGLAGTLKEIKTAVGNDAAALNDIAGSQQAFALATALTSDNLKAFDVEVKGLQNSTSVAAQSTGILAEGLENRTAAFAAATERLKVSVTRDVLPLATAFVKFSTSVVDGITALPAPIKNLGLAATGAAAGIGLLAGTILSAKALFGLFGIEGVAASGALTKAVSLLTKEYSATAVGAGVVARATKAFSGAAVEGAGSSGALSAALSQTAKTIGSLGILTVAGAIVIKLASDFAEARDEVGRLNDELVTTGESFKNVTTGFNTGNLLGKSGKELDDAKVSLETIDKAIKKQRDALEQETVVLPGDKKKTQQELVKDVLNPGHQFFEDATVETAPLAKDDPRRKQIEARIEELQKEREELKKVQDARKLSEAAAAQVTPYDKKGETADFRDKKAEIDSADETHKHKLALLTELRDANYRLLEQDRNLSREVNSDIAREQKAANKDVADAVKKTRAETVKQAVQDIENSKKTSDQKAADLKLLAAKYADFGDIRRSIEDKVLAFEKKAQAEREKIAERQKKIALDTSSEKIKIAEHELEQLRKLEEKDVDTSPKQVEQLNVKAVEQKKQVDVKLKADLANESDPGNRTDLKTNSAREKADIERASQDAITDVTEQAQQRRLRGQQESLQQEISLSQRRGELLSKYASPTQANFQVLQEGARRIQLMIQEINLQKELTLTQTQDPAKIAAAEALAQRQILDARVQVREEIQAATTAIEEQQKKSRPQSSKEFSGNIQTLDQFVQGEKDRFQTKSSEEFFGKKKSPVSTIPGLSDFDIKKSILDEANRDPARPGGRGNGSSDGTQTTRQTPFSVSLQGTFRLVDSSNKEVGKLERLSVNGRNSDLTSEARQLGV